MKFQEGYVYHINDGYFSKVQDKNLMKNKENGTCRPTYLCIKDCKNIGLLWVVPMSTRVEKYQAIHDKQQAKYGKCLTIVMGKFDGRSAAFLLQNMFPITGKYLDHVHTRNGNPVPVSPSVAQEVRSNMQQLRQLIYRGKTVVFPDIKRLEQIMLAELNLEKQRNEIAKPAASTQRAEMALTEEQSHQHEENLDAVQPAPMPARQSFQELAAAAKAEAAKRNDARASGAQQHKPPEKQER